MAVSVILFCVLVLFMIAGAIPIEGGSQVVIFKTPLFLVLAGLLVVLLVGCCFTRRLTRKRIPFLLTHLGIAILLCGAGLGFMMGRKAEFGLPITQHHVGRDIPLRDGTSLNMGFGITVREFAVDYYSARYGLYRPPTGAATEDSDYQLVKEVTVEAEGAADLGASGEISGNELRNEEDGEWKRQYVLENEWILQYIASTPRNYTAQLRLTDDDENATDVELAVNHPVTFNGWRIYLMSYDQEARRYVVLNARRDPGRNAVIAGIWLVIIGTALMCFRKSKAPRTDDTN
ncbi:MAG: hypothetical protein HN742_39350 [Lentisphaerae bacterium]|jgi:cytochrome c biogenesis protein ResB|nr:hypothetical protein [Lentisphaerota bacterium]MBT4814183.1 hypothetical protein [Lentisphaerota bacterium]MBT5605967.1 hypothetical protein [Lentisphaerota bacterium]MBT7060537.1 hypothetical protein [Lentisphaerota bacterium]MBT7847990.1 hypothetical protein [Lentisphaerota bacterium]